MSTNIQISNQSTSLPNRQCSSITLTNLENEIITSIQDPTISKIDYKTLFLKIKELIYLVYFNAGFQIKGDTEDEKATNIVLFTQSFMRELIDNFPSYTLKDVEISFRRGVLKFYGEYMGINTTALFSWLKAYLSEKQEAIYKFNKIQDLNKTTALDQLTSQEREKLLISNSLKAFEIFRTTGYFEDYGNAIYNFLDTKQMLNFSAAEKNTFMALAAENIKTKNNPILETNPQKRREMINLLKTLESNPLNLHTQIICEAKKIALNKYFKKINEVIFQ